MQSIWRYLNRWLGIERLLQQVGEVEERARALSLEDAKRCALEEMGSPAWNCRRRELRTDEKTILGELGAELAAFFSEFVSVDNLHSNFSLNRETIRPYRDQPDLLQIGETLENCFIVTKRHDDSVYVLDQMEDVAQDSEAFPSVYHLIALEAFLMHSEGLQG